MRMWIDTSTCERGWHAVEKDEDGYVVLHADDEECTEAEFKVEEDGE